MGTFAGGGGRECTQVTVRTAVFQLLRDFGLTTVFGNPGSTELPMFRDFPADFRYVLGLQESISAACADGFAQATGNAALVNLHSAVGVGHALGNLFTAWRNQTPLVVVAGQQARSILPFEPFLYATQAAEFPKPYVKWSCEPARAEDVPAAIARAYYVAMQPPRGPTFVSVPVDDWDRLCEPVASRTVSRVVLGDPELLARAGQALRTARRPAIVVGASVARDAAWEEAVELAERNQAPVWVSPMSGRNSFPENHPLFAGFLPADRGKIVERLQGSDLVLVLGAPAFTYHVEGFGPHIPPGAELIQLTDDPSIAAWTPVGTSIVTDLRHGIRALLAGPLLYKRDAPGPFPRAPRLDGSRLTDRYLLQQIASMRPPGSVIVEEAPSSRGPMHDYLPIVDPDGFYTCASGGLGHGLPAAVGIALARPDRKVIAILGDGSSMYSIQGLWSAAQLRLSIAFIIIRNGRYEALHEFGQHFRLDQLPGTELPQIDFCGLARAQGVSASRVTSAGELDAALIHAVQSSEPVLVEVVTQNADTSNSGESTCGPQR
ncbi:MAG: benzoylformate decarboxylase [Gammaproteobacteria bacterium]|jgi:benzoylformate decarboxylase|nr:benzoylformate decarboxylase [Gammaproteobacteria bacterium]